MTTINTRNAMASFRMVDAVRFFSVLFFYRGFYYYYRAQNARLNRSVRGCSGMAGISSISGSLSDGGRFLISILRRKPQ